MTARRTSSGRREGTSIERAAASRTPKRLLVVAFHFPPDNTSTGVLRTQKFTSYLPQHGWHSHVLSVPERLYADRDPREGAPLPEGVTLERVWACDIQRAFAVRSYSPQWLAIPDRYWPWWFAATRAGLRAVREPPCHAIYSTYPMATAHLIALSLKRRTGLPWIADFRDPWVEDSMSPLRHRIEAHLERRVVDRADRVVCNHPAMRRMFVRTYPDVPAAKFVTITNGYDEADLRRAVPAPLGRFQLLYPGNIDAGNRNPFGLLAGVRLALDRGWLARDDLQVTFLGSGPYGASRRFIADLDRTGLGALVSVVVGRVPHHEALNRTAGADVVVVLSDNVDGRGRSINAWSALQVPAKLYEFLRLGRPLLALAAPGAIGEFLASVGGAEPIPPNDIERIAAALRDLYLSRKPVPGQVPPAPTALVPYNREALTLLLARELDTISGTQG